MIGLIDADILCYRVGYTTQDEPESVALDTLDSFIADLMMHNALIPVMDFEYYLTGKENFRYDVAVTQPYKGNRSKREKPVHLQAIRNRLVDTWGATISRGQEADDDMSLRQYGLGDESIIISLDKDLDMVPGWHYNFVKNKKYYTTPEQGLYLFYKQILTGDQVDNIKGATRIGPVKAEKILAKARTPLDMWKACVKAHDSEERALEDARLLWMRSKPDEMWEPPIETQVHT
jgi:hypothetical protein